MREEDKVLLLAEILGVDTSKYVSKYVEELRSSSAFLDLCNNVHHARGVNSYKAQNLIDEFESIDFSTIDSLKKCFILKAKINYLLNTSLESDYINPFFYNKESDNIEQVGDIIVDFDSKKYKLNDMILDERYTSIYKIDYLKNCYLEWRKELVEKFIDPLNALLINEKKLPKIEIFDINFSFILILLLVANIIFILAPFIPSYFIRTLYTQENSYVFMQIIFNLSFVLLSINNIICLFIIYFRSKKKGRYVQSFYIMKNSHEIISQLNKKCENFYAYILNGLNENRLLKKSIKHFSINSNYLYSLSLLSKLDNKELSEELKDNSLPFIFRLTFVSFCVICFLMIVIMLYLLWRK